jgi:hypothetical protein
MDARLDDADYSDSLSPEEEDFFAALSAEDDLGVVIRTSTWIEYYLRQLISLTLVDSSIISWELVPFKRLLEWAHAARCLPPDMKPVLGRYAHIRNTYAHAPTAELPTEKLGRALSSMNPAVRKVFKTIDGQGTYRQERRTDEQVRLRMLSHAIYSTLFVQFYDERRARGLGPRREDEPAE